MNMARTRVDGVTLPEKWSTASDRYQQWMGQATVGATARIVEYADIFAPFESDSFCLDVGCGGGSVPIQLREQAPIGTKVLATDISPGMLKQVDSLKLANVSTQQEDAIVLSGLQDDTFSHVFTSFAIQFTPNTPATIRQMYRVLRPGGIAGIVIWGDHHSLSSLHDRACRLINPQYKPVSPYAPTAWTSKDEHQRQLEQVGFTDVGIETMLIRFPVNSGKHFCEYWFGIDNPVTEKLLLSAEEQGISRDRLQLTVEKVVDEEYDGGRALYCTAVLGWGTKEIVG